MNSATTYLLPALQAPGLARVAIWAPRARSFAQSRLRGLIERACERLLEKGRRVAVISPHAPNLERTQACLLRRGLAKDRLWALHVAPVGCERIIELLFDRADRPDALFVTDDNLVEPLLAGLKRAKVRPGRDVYVLAHCNWPRPIGLKEGIEHIGFDVREVLCAAKEVIDAVRAGERPRRTVPPRFGNELTHSKSIRTHAISAFFIQLTRASDENESSNPSP
jgi:DNA-binding LacI/PurR family transcriptional regulator